MVHCSRRSDNNNGRRRGGGSRGREGRRSRRRHTRERSGTGKRRGERRRDRKRRRRERRGRKRRRREGRGKGRGRKGRQREGRGRGRERRGEEEERRTKEKEERGEEGRREEERREKKRKAKKTKKENKGDLLEQLNPSALGRRRPNSWEHLISIDVWQWWHQRLLEYDASECGTIPGLLMDLSASEKVPWHVRHLRHRQVLDMAAGGQPYCTMLTWTHWLWRTESVRTMRTWLANPCRQRSMVFY